MGKFRSNLKGKAKGKRWPKGQSSNSNPETRTFRDQAKSRFFQANIGSSCLTTAALKQHDAVQIFSVPKTPDTQTITQMEEDTESYAVTQTYDSSKTFASEWSDCTNMSFNRFMNVFRSDSALHKDMLAILAAITEVIKQNGGTETSTEYYCALLTTLEQMMDAEERSDDQITACLALLNMGMKTVPIPVMRTTFSNATKMLLTLVDDYKESEQNIIMKSVFGILGVLLKNQELALWTNSHTQQILQSILNPFSIHTKPKWRKAAQNALTTIINSEAFKTDQNFNPAADRIAEFCEMTLETCMGGNTKDSVLISSIQAGQTTILHTLGLLKDTIKRFSKSHIKTCCEMMLRLVALNYPLVTSCSFQVLYNLFSAQQVVVSGKLNAQLISALYSFQPSALDVQPTLAWLAVMQQAHIHLADVDENLSVSLLPKIFTTINELWLTQKPEIVRGATRTLEVIIKDCVPPLVETEVSVLRHGDVLAKCFHTVELGLGYQYHHAWHQVLHVISIIFAVAGANCSQMMLGILKTLSELRDSYKFSYNNELEHAVGAAIRSMGPEVVLGVISLKKDNGDLNLDRSWLLPVLKENIRQSTVAFWLKVLFPLATYCQKRSVALAATNDGIGAHCAELLHLQLWSLLPCFCKRPSDIQENFKNIAKLLGMALSDRKELRLSVMASLRHLINSAKELEDKADLNEIARFDKNYLPILFNIYTTKTVGTDEKGIRLSALETIKIYLTIARPTLTTELCHHALERLHNLAESDDFFMKESLYDLIKALIPYQSTDNVRKIFEDCVKDLPTVKNSKEQKKVYRLLEEICRCESDNCKTFINNNKKVIQKLLKKALNSSAVTSRGARLRCFNYLLKAQPQLNHESILVRAVLPEAVLGCSDINVRCRLVAYDILNRLGEMLQDRDEMDQYITMIVAGLAGNDELISATILALASILNNFTGALGQENIRRIFETVLNLTSVRMSTIVKSCIAFIKVYMSSLPAPMTAAALPNIVKAICAMTSENKKHYRMELKALFAKVIRKYGWDTISPHIPQDEKDLNKPLRNLRKQISRLKRQKLQEKNEQDDEDMEEEFMVKTKPKSMEDILADSDSEFDDDDDGRKEFKSKSSRKYRAYIEEDEDDIVDFNDPMVVSKITANKPNKQKGVDASKDKGKKDRGFKTAADGRLIIEDMSDSDDDTSDVKKTMKKKSVISFDSDSDSGDETISKAETQVLQNKKRKRSDASSVASSFASKSQYQPGGSGIHRKTSANSVKSGASGAGSEYKSKKAMGDVKKKGKVDPYAYLPLSRTALNKRKRLKHIGQFKHIIGAAKTGALKGKKAKRKQ